MSPQAEPNSTTGEVPMTLWDHSKTMVDILRILEDIASERARAQELELLLKRPPKGTDQTTIDEWKVQYDSIEEYCDQISQSVSSALESLTGSMDAKIDSIVGVIDDLQVRESSVSASSSHAREVSDRMKRHADALDGQVARLKHYLGQCLAMAGRRKGGNSRQVWIQANGGKPRVDIADGAEQAIFEAGYGVAVVSINVDDPERLASLMQQIHGLGWSDVVVSYHPDKAAIAERGWGGDGEDPLAGLVSVTRGESVRVR
jgi:hypothetical protein